MKTDTSYPKAMKAVVSRLTAVLAKSRVLELSIHLLLFALLHVAWAAGQERNQVNGGKGIDGAHYYQVAEQLASGADRIEGTVPFVHRVGTPYLVSRLFPSN